MASNPPGACCFEKTVHEGTPIGSFTTVGDLPTYVTGEEFGNEKLLVIFIDVFGYDFVNTNLVADALAKLGKYKVLVPDILLGDPYKSGGFEEYLPKHTPEITNPVVDKFLKYIKGELQPKFTYGIGYCFGGKYVVRHLSKDGLFDAGAIAHPSLISEDDVEAVTKPLLISAAQTDGIFTVEGRHKTEEILSKKEGLKWEITVFGGVSHGYAVRGDITNPQVKYAKERTLSDQLNFFATL